MFVRISVLLKIRAMHLIAAFRQIRLSAVCFNHVTIQLNDLSPVVSVLIPGIISKAISSS